MMKTVSSGGTGAACCEPKVALESRVITSGADWGRWGCALQAVEKLAEAAGYILGVGQALWQVGCSLSDQGLWAEAEAPLRRSLTILEAELHSDHLDLGRVCNGVPCSLTQIICCIVRIRSKGCTGGRRSLSPPRAMLQNMESSSALPVPAKHTRSCRSGSGQAASVMSQCHCVRVVFEKAGGSRGQSTGAEEECSVRSAGSRALQAGAA